MEPEEEPSVAAAREVCEEVGSVYICFIFIWCKDSLCGIAFLAPDHTQKYYNKNGFPIKMRSSHVLSFISINTYSYLTLAQYHVAKAHFSCEVIKVE